MTDSELKAIAAGLAPVLREFVDSRVRERLNEIIVAVSQQNKELKEFYGHLDSAESRMKYQLEILRSEVFGEENHG